MREKQKLVVLYHSVHHIQEMLAFRYRDDYVKPPEWMAQASVHRLREYGEILELLELAKKYIILRTDEINKEAL